MGGIGDNALARAIHEQIKFFKHRDPKKDLIAHNQWIIAGLPTQYINKKRLGHIGVDVAAIRHLSFGAADDHEVQGLSHKPGQHRACSASVNKRMGQVSMHIPALNSAHPLHHRFPRVSEFNVDMDLSHLQPPWLIVVAIITIMPASPGAPVVEEGCPIRRILVKRGAQSTLSPSPPVARRLKSSPGTDMHAVQGEPTID